MDSSMWAPEDQNHQLFFSAITTGDIGLVKESLKSNVNVDLLYGDRSEGETALHTAASSGNIELVSLLLAHGASVDVLNWEVGGLSTPLHNAASSAHVPIMRLLLDNGASVDAVGFLGGTPLHQVLYHATSIKPRHFDAIALLLDRGADIHAAMQWNGDTILYQAAEVGDVGMLQFLLAKGADINHNPQLYSKRSALASAVSHRKKNAVEFLVSKGAIVDEKVVESAFTIPMFNLIRCYADKTTLFNSRALHSACQKAENGFSLASHMLAVGMDVNAKDKFGDTPLLSACGSSKTYPKTLDLLLKNNADASARSTGKYANFDRGDSPLHRAAWRSDAEIVSLLLEASCDVHARNESQQTALGRFAVHIGGNYADSAATSEWLGHPRLQSLKMLIEAGANVNVQDSRGRTPLHELVLCCTGDSDRQLKLAAVRILIEAGADTSIADLEDRTVQAIVLTQNNSALSALLGNLK